MDCRVNRRRQSRSPDILASDRRAHGSRPAARELLDIWQPNAVLGVSLPRGHGCVIGPVIGTRLAIAAPATHDPHGRDLDGMEPAVSTTFPPPEPGRHGIAELLTLVGEIRAFGNLPPIEALGRIRDLYHEYDGA
jgi:hypothetical protein